MPNTPPADVSLEVRFWSRVDVFDHRDPNACALWRGHKLPSGYGTLTDAEGTKHYAHRVAYLVTRGPVPEGMVVRHRCPDGPDRSCCRPGHMMLGTYSDNAQDTIEDGRTRVLPVLTHEDVVAIRYMYDTARWSQGDLALLFYGDGAGQPAIQRIVTGETYTSVGGPITKRGRGRPPARRAKP